MEPVIFLSSHPIQYFAPMYQSLVSEGLQVKVYYCSRHGLEGEADKEFDTSVQWDIPLLTGYPYKFLKNYFTRPSVYHFLGLINPGIIKELVKAPRSLVVVHGWNYFTNILAIITAKLMGHTVCLRAETPLCHELLRPPASRRMRKFILKGLLFPWFDYFLYIGKQNKAFYKFYGVKEKALLFTPYAVDNNRFSSAFERLKATRNNLRTEMRIDINVKVLLFSGKYITKKRPLDLLKAFKLLQQQYPDVYLVMVGEGNLRGEMEKYIEEKHLQNIILTGFVNQQAITKYYAVADIFIMCSGTGETWGLSANEAMNFGLPLVLSDLTGCADDLVMEGENGYTFKTGNSKELADKLSLLLAAGNQSLQNAGQLSAKIVNEYSYHQTAEALKKVACV